MHNGIYDTIKGTQSEVIFHIKPNLSSLRDWMNTEILL